MEDLLREFVVECNEGLQKLDQDVLHLEKHPNDTEVLNNIFRVLHSIKGTGGMLGLSRLEKVAHAAENLLGKVRDGEINITTQAIGHILKSVDTIKEILNQIDRTGREPDGCDDELIANLNIVNSDVSSAVLQKSPVSVANVSVPTLVEAQTLRVNLDVLDRLMNLVGELVLTRNQLVQLVRSDDESKYSVPIQQLNRITSGLQESVMTTRMQPIGNAWGKLPRIVRDLASQCGKQIQLVMSGQETEIDRQVLQAIQDPLVHCVRNSADHGLESTIERSAKGKPEQGTISLNAFHEGGQIIIEIIDDGRGINIEKVKERAIQNGLVRQDEIERLSEHKIMNFIFEPGFSTADKVTEVSGRGVGMDVVRTHVEQIGGTIEIDSKKDVGTTIRIKIPLTLAIVSALIVKVGATQGETFAMPQAGVVELVRISENTQHLIEKINNSMVLKLRDKLVPLINLANFLGYVDDIDVNDFSIVVARVNNVEFGLIVNEVFDTQEIVVKPIGRFLRDIHLFAGSTILGDGRVIIILDMGRIADRAEILKTSVEQKQQLVSQEVSNSHQVKDDLTTLLLFRAGDCAPMAVPLERVSRLEEFQSSKIEFVENRMVVQYRGCLLPIHNIDGHEMSSANKSLSTIIFSENGRTMGLAVTEVMDIVETKIKIDSSASKRGVIGCAIVRDRATELIDANYYLHLAFQNMPNSIESLKMRVA